MTRLIVIISALVLLTACDPAADKQRAVTSNAAPVTAASTAGEKYRISPPTSKIEFIGSKVTGSHLGSFEKFSGEIDYAGAPEKSRVSITMEMNSVKTEEADLTKHLQTPDFFDVAKFPQSTFVSTEIKSGGDKGASHTITGNLTLHGVTKSITFPATIGVAPDAITVESSFSINRKDFGINYAGAADNLIRNDVVLTLHVRATK
ncbi:MAG TPA: YceI family protein [Pyrinomonadaceae bacterium]|nr:YceI family protein [Pyrinomonadaceae bacterium]